MNFAELSEDDCEYSIRDENIVEGILMRFGHLTKITKVCVPAQLHHMAINNNIRLLSSLLSFIYSTNVR